MPGRVCGLACTGPRMDGTARRPGITRAAVSPWPARLQSGAHAHSLREVDRGGCWGSTQAASGAIVSDAGGCRGAAG